MCEEISEREEIPYREHRIVDISQQAFRDHETEIDETWEVDTFGYSDLALYIEVDGACVITLDAVSQVSEDYDTEHSVNSFITINETVATFVGAGTLLVDLNEVITTKEALKFRFLRFTVNAAVTMDFAMTGKLTNGSMLGKQEPLVKYSAFNTAVTAAADIFAAVLTPSYATAQHNTYFRIYCTFDTAGVLTVRRTQAAVTISENLNSGANLTANAAYVFDIVIRKNQTIQLRYSVNANALELSVSEIGGGI